MAHLPGEPTYVHVLTNDGNGSFHVSGKHSAVGVLDHLVTADTNGDGLSDILYTSGINSDPIVLGVELRDVTGSKAFPGQSSAALLAAVLRDEPKPLSELKRDIPAEVTKDC